LFFLYGAVGWLVTKGNHHAPVMLLLRDKVMAGNERKPFLRVPEKRPRGRENAPGIKRNDVTSLTPAAVCF
jgi:hypothetical protein